MTPSIIPLGQTTMALCRLGPDDASVALVWAHGWGQSGAAFMELARAFQTRAQSMVLDLPGFGASGLPPEGWGTENYADAIADWLATLPPGRRVWIGHSFGCRVGLQVAARHPTLLDGMVLVAAAGLPPHRGIARKVALRSRIYAYKVARMFVPEGPARDHLRARFGSVDARNAGPLRKVLVRAVNENLSNVAARVRCPTVLIYGDGDQDTPPEIGERLHRLISGSQLRILNGYDHHTILTNGRYQVAGEIQRLLKGLG